MDSVRFEMDNLSTLPEPFLESIIHAAPIAIVAFDEKLRVRLMNPQSRSYLEVPAEEAVVADGGPITDFLTKFGISASLIIDKLRASCFHFDLSDIKLGNHYLNVCCRPLMDGALITFLPINSLKEKETLALHALLEGQELERKRLAQNIHDGIGPLLSTLKMGLQHLQAAANLPLSQQEVQVEYTRLIDLVDLVTADIRNISHSLLPPALMDFGLDNALSNLCQLIQTQSKLPIDCFVPSHGTRLEPNAELGLYRIAQELLNNALKYASASRITVQLIRHEATVVLMVEDDGVGFNISDLKKNHLDGIGFKNILARAESLGGTFSLDSAPNEGVVATVEIPLNLAHID